MTILEMLIERLPERYVDAIVNNIKDRSTLHKKAGTFSGEMLTLFDWNESREGYEFWDELLDAVLTNEELPPLPITIEYFPNTTIVCDKTVVVMNASNTNINIAYDFSLKDIKLMDNFKKEKILSFIN